MKILRIANNFSDAIYDKYQDGVLKRDIMLLIHESFQYDTQIQNDLAGNNRKPKTKIYTRAIPIHNININTQYDDNGLIQLSIDIVIPKPTSMSDKNNAANTAIRILQSGNIHQKIEELTGVYPEINLLGDSLPR